MISFILNYIARGLKSFLPKTLFWRALIIILTPVLLLQIISIYVFIDRHWSKVTDRLSYAVAGEVTVIADSIDDSPPKDRAARVANIATYTAQSLDLLIRYEPGGKIGPGSKNVGSWHSLVADSLEDQLDGLLGRPYSLRVGENERWVEISVQLTHGVLVVACLERRLFSSTTYIFLIWMISSSIILFAISILFMRNQIKPIRRLAIAATRFGMGRDVSNFKPEGALEVRQAGRAFRDMSDRIRRQMEQRTAMLAGVSHDLRTPLTRMKLGLSMLPSTTDTQALLSDVQDMEHMIEGYLAFARGAGQEESVTEDLKAFVLDVVRNAHRAGYKTQIGDLQALNVPIKPLALARCLLNILENAYKYAQNHYISVHEDMDTHEAVIQIDDDGPGIPEVAHDDVFKPFFRMEASRNPQTGGVGLGLPVALDIAHAHGGSLKLKRSPSGGLRVELRLPL